MPTLINKKIAQSREKKQCINRESDNVEQVAQAKTDHAWNTVFKHVDWNKFEEMRNKQ